MSAAEQLDPSFRAREQWCYDLLRRLLWPEGVVCFRCRGRRVVVCATSPASPRRKYRCRDCRHIFTDLSETPMAHTNLPLSTWCLYLRLRGQGLRASELARELGVKWDTVTYLMDRVALAERRPGILQQLRDAVQRGW